MKVGILGAGTIVPDFLKSTLKVKEVIPYAILGRDVPSEVEIMTKFSKEYNIKKMYFDYDEMLKDSDIDVIYVALPNNLHYSYAKKALEANKSVIVEKPFTSNSNQAKELAELAKSKNLFVFEAMPIIYYPNFVKIKELIKQIGDVKLVFLNISKFSRRYDDFKNGDVHPSFDPKKSGGALMDLNVYNVHFILNLFGFPDSIAYYANVHRGVDTSGSLILDFPTHKCILLAAKDSSSPSGFFIQGDKGLISSESATHIMKKVDFKLRDGEESEFELNDEDIYSRLQYEISEFYNMWASKDYTKRDQQLEVTINVLKVLEQSLKQMGIETCL